MQENEIKEIINESWNLFESKEYDAALAKLATLDQDSANSCYLSGILRYYKNDFEEAEKQLLKSLIFENSKSFDGYIHHWLGNVYAFDDFFTDLKNTVSDKKKAEKEYGLAIQKNKFPVEAYHELVKFKNDLIDKEMLLLKGIQKFPLDIDLRYSLYLVYHRQGDSVKTKNILIEAIKSGIKSSAINFLLGKLFLTDKKYDEALKYFTVALEHNDNNSGAQLISYYIGVTTFYLGLFEKSATIFLESINYYSSDSSSWYPRVGYIFCLYKLNRKKKIREYFDELEFELGLFQDISFGFNLMSYLDASTMIDGELEFSAKKLIAALKPAILSSSGNQYKLKVNLVLAALYHKDDDKINCLNCYRELHAYSYQYEFVNSSIQNLYINCVEANLDFEQIVTFFQEDIKQNSLKLETRGEVLIEVVKKLFKLKHYGRIVEMCKSIHNQDLIPNEIYFRYAYSLAESGQENLAKEYYEKEIDKNNNSSASLNNLAVIYRTEGNLERASALFKAAVKIDPNSTLYKSNLKATIEQISEKSELPKNNLIPKHWFLTKTNLDIAALSKIEYFTTINKIEKTNKKYRELLSRDFKELTFNYLVGNHKSTVVIAGSLVELALTYYCEKKKLSSIELKDATGKLKKIKLYDAVLHDLITYSHQQNWFGNDFHSLGNLSRIYRNFIHPGLEIKSKADIVPKANLCYLSTIEILKKVLS